MKEGAVRFGRAWSERGRKDREGDEGEGGESME